MQINCKEGVWFKFIDEIFMVIAHIVYEEYANKLVTPTVTSACDSYHKAGSLHFQGLAWDWRVWGLENPQGVADRIRIRVRKISPRYDVVYGDADHLDHIHTEFDIYKEE